MLHVSIRRRIAVTMIVVCLVLFAVVTGIVVRNYAPENLRKRVKTAFEASTGLHINIGKPSLSVDNSVTFRSLSIGSGDKAILTTGPAMVVGLPGVGGAWKPRMIHLTQVVIYLDLSKPAALGEALSALSSLIDRTSEIPLGTPPELTVEVNYEGCPGAKFIAASGPFLEERTLNMVPRTAGPEKDFSFTVTRTQGVLTSPMSNSEYILVQAIARKAGRVVLERAANAAEGVIKATWDRDGESVTFANAKGWLLDQSVVATLGLDLAGGSAEVVVTGFTVTNDKTVDLEGSVFYSALKLETVNLSRWLAAAGVPLPSGGSLPAQFENVRIAADFAVKNGTVSVRPVSERPALVWCEVDGQTIVLVKSEGQAQLADVLSGLSSGETSPE